jgi:hypothetical protein
MGPQNLIRCLLRLRLFVPTNVQDLIMVLRDFKDGLGIDLSMEKQGQQHTPRSLRQFGGTWLIYPLPDITKTTIDQELIGNRYHCLRGNFQ